MTPTDPALTDRQLFHTQTVVAFSGGKDSTAMMLRMAELGETFVPIFTPTMNEPDELFAFVDSIEAIIGQPIIKPQAPTLAQLIESFEALPNFRQRWCTRMIKIQPCIAYLMQHVGSTLCVGLRHDEPEREGLYGDYCEYRYPLREWKWGICDVLAYLHGRGINVPRRTNCVLCYDQGLRDWYWLWKNDPESWAKGEALEARYGHTLRSPSRDNWPASLVELAKEFQSGRKPRGLDTADQTRCRVCRI